MKKTLSILLALAMSLCLVGAVAESEMPFEGTYLGFEDYGFAICLPNEWNVIEVAEDAAANGMIFVSASEDGARTMQIQYSELPEPVESIDALVAELSDSYQGVKAVKINDIDFAAFTIAEQNINAIACVGGEGIGLFVFYFTPADDAEFMPIAEAIAGSITPYTAE